ncbi:MAG: hypothetical protein P8Z31_01350 [Gammaproteobacteria bacterium]|jgi:hypothetical protein
MFLEQLSRNALALVSLLVALTALGYNTWRNELTEHNRNIRFAGFEMLLRVSELRRISYIAHYDGDSVRGNPRSGWVEVQVIRDLGMIMPQPLQASTGELLAVWQREWPGLGNSDASIQAIENALDGVRAGILDTLEELE